jgi:hypothetical protein
MEREISLGEISGIFKKSKSAALLTAKKRKGKLSEEEKARLERLAY